LKRGKEYGVTSKNIWGQKSCVQKAWGGLFEWGGRWGRGTPVTLFGDCGVALLTPKGGRGGGT